MFQMPSNLLKIQPAPALQSWNDLSPEGERAPFDDPYARLSPDQLQNLRDLNRITWLLETGKAEPEGSSAQRAHQLRQAFAEAGLDADWLLAQREVIRQQRIQQSYNPRMDGQFIKLLGQVLPVEWTEERQVTQVLLTPSLPSCSHMPPPPSDQVVRVNAIEPIDIVVEERQQNSPNLCLWVEGTLRFAVTNHALYRGDGILRVEAMYELEPTTIVPATAQEVERVFKRPRRETEAILCPNLMDLIGDR